MAKRSNINYKYLRRRKNWFQRNIGMLIFLAVLLVILAVVIIGAVHILKNRVSTKSDDTNKEDNVVIEESTTAEEKKEPVWINNEEPVIKSVDYKVPEDISNPYYIKVNIALNCVTVYGIDSDGEYTIPVKAFACSSGREDHETIKGEAFEISDQFTWGTMVDGTFAQYVSRFSGAYLFHSVPYMSYYKGDLEEGQFNLLGDYASLGCVRLCVRDAKWIYDNCSYGTLVDTYEDKTNPGPLGKPETIKIPEDSEYIGWDPTDDDEDNPWLNEKAKIKGAKDLTTTVGKRIDIMGDIKALDTCGNDITKNVVAVGKYTFDIAGKYTIKYTVIDAIGSKAEETITLNVLN